MLRLVLVCTVAAVSACAATVGPDTGALTVHEWGTFTSVAAPDGSAVVWLPLAAPSDLPCFVHRLPLDNPKGSSAFIRMETPVIYFYTPRPMAASVAVRFPQGRITEWYPQASRFIAPTMEWNVDVKPDMHADLPTESGGSHYYAARQTDAAPVQAGNEREKLIFYRGIGYFQPPIQPRFTADGKLELGKNAPAETIVFENRKGQISWRRSTGASGTTVDTLRQEMEAMLTSQGLYTKEARAMLETWRDSWFEEGSRVLYIVPRAFVDKVLPLAVQPQPAALERVFVGRAELLSPSMRAELEHAVAVDDPTPLAKHGRFLQPFLMQVPAVYAGRSRPRVRAFLDDTYRRVMAQNTAAACR